MEKSVLVKTTWKNPTTGNDLEISGVYYPGVDNGEATAFVKNAVATRGTQRFLLEVTNFPPHLITSMQKAILEAYQNQQHESES